VNLKSESKGLRRIPFKEALTLKRRQRRVRKGGNLRVMKRYWYQRRLRIQRGLECWGVGDCSVTKRPPDQKSYQKPCKGKKRDPGKIKRRKSHEIHPSDAPQRHENEWRNVRQTRTHLKEPVAGRNRTGKFCAVATWIALGHGKGPRK